MKSADPTNNKTKEKDNLSKKHNPQNNKLNKPK